MFWYRFHSLLVLFFVISCSAIDVKLPFDTNESTNTPNPENSGLFRDTTVVKPAEDAFEQCIFELNQSAIKILRNYEDKLHNKTRQKEEQISSLEHKITLLERKSQQTTTEASTGLFMLFPTT